VGEYISLKIAQAAWGEKSIVALAKFIETKHPEVKGYGRTTLYRMRHFYAAYKDTEIVPPVVGQIQNADNEGLTIVAPVARQVGLTDIRATLLTTITWTNHLIILERAKSPEERAFYLRLCSRENYSKRELDRQISSGAFERVMLGNQQLPGPLQKGRPELTNTFKSDYVLEFLNLPIEHNEGDLQKALIGQMKKFILELGKEFLFMGEEYRLQVGNSDFKCDLLFFHRGLQSLVLFELLCCAQHNNSYVA